MKNHRSSTGSALLALASLLLAPTSGSIATEEAPAPDGPQVGGDYQETVDRAWGLAVTGEKPTNTCAAVKGRVVGKKDRSTEALRALLACNVDIPVRYFESYLDKVEAGEKTCMNYMMEMTTQLPAMTMSTDVLGEMVDSIEGSGDEQAQAVAAEVLNDAAIDATADKGVIDPKRIIKNRLTERTQAVCPEIASVVLR